MYHIYISVCAFSSVQACMWIIGQHLPFDQLHDNEVTTISGVVKDQAIRTGGLELEEEVHGGIGLQSGEGQIAGLG